MTLSKLAVLKKNYFGVRKRVWVNTIITDGLNGQFL